MATGKRPKTKVTIETEGQPTQVLEINGMAAAMMVDGEDSEHYGLKICILGCLSNRELLQLRDGVTHELKEAIEANIKDKVSLKDLLLALLGEE